MTRSASPGPTAPSPAIQDEREPTRRKGRSSSIKAVPRTAQSARLGALARSVRTSQVFHLTSVLGKPFEFVSGVMR
jgi:hypothetical protein